MRRNRLFEAVASILIFGACALPNLHRGLPSLPDEEHFRWVADGLEIKGEGRPDTAAYIETQRKATSRDAAYANALARLAAYEGMIVIPEKGRIADLARKDPSWEARLKHTVAGIEIRSTNYDIDDSADVIIWISQDALEALRHPQ